jgi:lipopolysaccharide exporter
VCGAPSSSPSGGRRTAARLEAEWVGVETGEAHEQRLDGTDGRDEPSLTARAAVGLGWSAFGYGALLVANLAYTMSISRLVDPVAFGLMALAQLVVLFAQFFVRMGLASALVQKSVLSKDDIRAASTAGLAVGVVCFCLVWVLAPLFGSFFRAPDLPPVLRLLGLTFLFEGLAMVGLGLLRREHRFRELSVITLATYVLGYLVVGVGLALLGAGVWSLVVGALVSSGSQMVWQYALLRHPIRPVLRRDPYREVCGYGMRLMGSHLLDYVGANLDTYTVGRFADTAVVGQYTRGYYLAFQPLRVYLAQAITNVLFPHLSRIQHDARRLRRAYLSVLALGAILVFPVCAGMAVAARELVLVVLGQQWSVAATTVPWFALAAGCSVMSALSQTVAEARADLYRSLGVQAVYILVLAAFLAVAVAHRSHGIWVFAAAVAAAEVLRHVGYLGLMRRVVGLTMTAVWASYAPAAFASVGVALAVAVVRAALAPHTSTLVTFAAELAAGALALSLCVRFCPLPTIRRELRMRLTAAGVLGAIGGLRWRLASLVLGQPDPRS